MTDLAWSREVDERAIFDDSLFSDDELSELALSADPAAPLADDAVPLQLYPGAGDGLLPSWYMPPVMARTVKKRWHRVAIGAVVVAFLIIDLCGLCSTYGPLVAA